VTSDKDFKKVVRARAEQTGESYSTARSQLEAAARPPEDPGLVFAHEQLVSYLNGIREDFRSVLDSLTNDEYLWEPVPGCPALHLQDDGTYRADSEFPIRGAATIGARVCWAAQLILVDTSQHYGDKSVTHADVQTVPGVAAKSVEVLDNAIAAWIRAIAACEPRRLTEHSENKSPGAIDGQFPLMQVVLFKAMILVQCSVQASMTRHLYRHAHASVAT
jgi:hypothetical protein